MDAHEGGGGCGGGGRGDAGVVVLVVVRVAVALVVVVVVRISKGCSSAEVEASVAARVEVGWCGERLHLRGREREAEGEVVRARGAAPADRALERAVLLQHGEGGARGYPGGRTALHVLVFDLGTLPVGSAEKL